MKVAHGRIQNSRRLATDLTRRETEVLRLMWEGRGAQEIADLMYVALSTVHKHQEAIYGKFGVRSAVAACREGIERGIL